MTCFCFLRRAARHWKGQRNDGREVKQRNLVKKYIRLKRRVQPVRWESNTILDRQWRSGCWTINQADLAKNNDWFLKANSEWLGSNFLVTGNRYLRKRIYKDSGNYRCSQHHLQRTSFEYVTCSVRHWSTSPALTRFGDEQRRCDVLRDKGEHIGWGGSRVSTGSGSWAKRILVHAATAWRNRTLCDAIKL